MDKLFNDNSRGAVISSCGRHRYKLWRVWDKTLQFCMFVMHNPSTADHNHDDPTIRRCIGFAKSWGYGGIFVGNLSPYRATNPSELLHLPSADLLSPIHNIIHTNEMIAECSMHVLAYGNPVRKELIPTRIDDFWHFLSLTKAGNPGHPLYLKKSLKPQKINQ
jgi:hypothetical protein